jgi:hypothetical protein
MNIIEVQYANYHNAVLTGRFILASNPPSKFMKNGYRNAVIVCTWFGYRLKGKGLNISFNPNRSSVIYNFTGEVFTNIS